MRYRFDALNEEIFVFKLNIDILIVVNAYTCFVELILFHQPFE